MGCPGFQFFHHRRSVICHLTIQYNTIQQNPIQYNTIQCNTIQYNSIPECMYLQEFPEYLKKLETILESKNKCVESLRAQVACYSLRAAYWLRYYVTRYYVTRYYGTRYYGTRYYGTCYYGTRYFVTRDYSFPQQLVNRGCVERVRLSKFYRFTGVYSWDSSFITPLIS